MANKWRTTIADADWTFVRYSVNPNDLSDETLTRKVSGVSRTESYTLLATLRAQTTITDPVVDNQTYTGTWSVKSVEPVADESGNTAGSVEIVQVLALSRNDYATESCLKLVRSRVYPVEQNENAWMYYERFKEEETTRWNSMTATAVSGQVFNGLRRIWTATDLRADVQAGIDRYVDPDNPSLLVWRHRRYLYNIVFGDTNPVANTLVGIGTLEYGKYYIAGTPVWMTYKGEDQWRFTWEEIESPIIRECYYEDNGEGTYNIYRVLETTTDTALVRTRPLKYAGMVLVSGTPLEDDTKITLTGFITQTEVIHQHARFRIGGDVYRVTSDTTAVAGKATDIPITPAITAATEDVCAENTNQVQAFFEAL